MFFKKKEEPKPMQMGIPTINEPNPIKRPPEPTKLESVNMYDYIDTKGGAQPQYIDNVDEKPSEIPHSITISGSKEWVEAVISQLNR